MKRFPIVIILLLVCCSVALAAEEGVKALDPLWREVGNYIGVLVAGFLISLVSKLLKELEERKLITEEKALAYEARAQAEADRIVAAVEAYAISKGRQLSAEDKLARAAGKLAKRYGFDTEKAEEYVEAALIPLAQGAGKALARLSKG